MSFEAYEYEALLQEIQLINMKYEPILNSVENKFNIFSILRKEHDEEGLHSQFLCSLLNPWGSHAQGKTFLKLFLEEIKFNDFQIEHPNISVRKEHQHVDIYITNGTQAIIIENKIYAGDQWRQLERYYNKIKEKGIEDIKIVYLTLDGKEPSAESLGKLQVEMVDCISYGTEIDRWLGRCIQAVPLVPVLRETINQYQKLIHGLTGKSNSGEYIMELKNILLKDPKNLQMILDINQALDLLNRETQLQFWEELEETLQNKGYSVTSSFCENINGYYEKKKGRPYYGIYFNIKTNIDISYVIEIHDSIYHGFTGRGHHLTDREDTLIIKTVKEIDASFKKNHGSFGLKGLEPHLDFRNFHDPNVAELADPQKRSKRIQKIVEEVEKNIAAFKKLYSAPTSIQP